MWPGALPWDVTWDGWLLHGMSWDLLWLKVRELSRLPNCCNLACIIPVLLRETGNVWDFRSWTMGPNPSWFLQHEWNGIEAKVRLVTLQRDKSISKARTQHRGDWPRADQQQGLLRVAWARDTHSGSSSHRVHSKAPDGREAKIKPKRRPLQF